MSELKWFNQEIEDVLEKQAVAPDRGLSDSEVAERLNEWGSNELPKAKSESVIIKFLKHFHDVLIYVLLAAAVITVLLGHYIDTAVILAVVIINATIGYFQEYKAEKALEGIRNMLSVKTTVLRSGNKLGIDAAEMVPGDITILRAGDKVPADMRLVKADNLQVEESSLTGESEAVEKQTSVLPEDTVLGDRTNMVFAGTAVAAGSGRGIVVATGGDTELGKISSAMVSVEQLQTPLLKQTADFGKLISVIIVFSAVVMFFIGYLFHDYETGELLLAIIGLIVAAIPEGLPAILSIILALGVQTMAGKNAIVRNLPSVETLGAVTVICSDKTGTLTKNEMTVKSVIADGVEFEVSGTGYSPEGSIQRDGQEIAINDYPVLEQFLLCVKTVNDSHLYKEGNSWKVSGGPTEGCLLTLAEKADKEIGALPIISKIPFDSSYKYMAALVEENDQKSIFVKGAPEKLLEMVSADKRDFWKEQIAAHAKRGERLLAAAVKQVTEDVQSIDHEDLEEGYEFLGLAGIIDPPREEVIDSIAQCRKAGIQVKMITGDHKETAVAIGAKLGIGNGEKVIEGLELDAMDTGQLEKAAVEYDVFARTSPTNKLQLVEALQAQRHICAMTGDGVNDAPALKRADIGIAMGIKGTEVSKEAAEMVLVDDNFNTIVNAVKEGRRVYDNLKKTILFILPTNVSEGMLIFISILLGTTIPLTPVQILWVNMITAVTISLAIAFEKLEPGTMERPPRKVNSRLLSRYAIFRIAFVSLIICGGILWMNSILAEQNYDVRTLQTMTLQSLVISQLFYLFNCRNEWRFALNRDFFSNKAAFLVSGILIGVQLAVTYVPFMNTVLGTVPIGIDNWIGPILIGFSVFVLVEVEKWFVHKFVTPKLEARKNKTETEMPEDNKNG
ncbi:cation-transporting P-type ATPase [Planococcus salinarum]|uniref:cation-transporting P-type ATPase n=1 Tax=Planococcus salinarum TaxID=622695 RepID=UPI000E3DE123|nr:cation-transporting P-type ATPase [Planococcus salinarum]TAA66871.1 cation-transporting P-type ATPase [Planococcus salinarum]